MDKQKYWDLRSLPYKLYYNFPFISRISHSENQKAQNMLLYHPHKFKTRTILNIACGVAPLYPVSRNDTCINLDYSFKMLRQNRRVKEGIFIQADAQNLPFRSSLFSHLISVGFSEYINNPEGWLKEISEVLKPSGLLLITSTPDNFITRLRRIFNPVIHYRSLNQWRTLAKRNNYEVLRCEKGILQEIILMRKA